MQLSLNPRLSGMSAANLSLVVLAWYPKSPLQPLFKPQRRGAPSGDLDL
jgi:hypothetical protein